MARCGELLDQACVKVEDWQEVVTQLEAFAKPFAQTLVESAQRRHLVEDMAGLLSTLKRKTHEGIAYLHGQDRKRLQQFIGESPWEYAPLINELTRQIGAQIGEPDGVIVFDPSACAKKGTKSVGVARQWSGRLGQVDSCQVGVYLGEESRQEYALVNTRLYLPTGLLRGVVWRRFSSVCFIGVELGVLNKSSQKTQNEIWMPSFPG